MVRSQAASGRVACRDCDDPDDMLAVEAQPGNYMAFFAPWDSGVYDTCTRWDCPGLSRVLSAVRRCRKLGGDLTPIMR
jgi:hypothetical protein